jgi:hypothetical protein
LLSIAQWHEEMLKCGWRVASNGLILGCGVRPSAFGPCPLWVICTDFGLTADIRLGGDSGNAGPLLMVSAGKLMSEEADE